MATSLDRWYRLWQNSGRGTVFSIIFDTTRPCVLTCIWSYHWHDYQTALQHTCKTVTLLSREIYCKVPSNGISKLLWVRTRDAYVCRFADIYNFTALTESNICIWPSFTFVPYNNASASLFNHILVCTIKFIGQTWKNNNLSSLFFKYMTVWYLYSSYYFALCHCFVLCLSLMC